jgi:hypothetical protein
MILSVNPLIAIGVLASTAATDAAYVFFNAAVTGRRRIWAANWSAIWYLLSICGYQLHGKCRLRHVCSRGLLDRRIRVRELAQARLGEHGHGAK